jgi:hypothetical protein
MEQNNTNTYSIYSDYFFMNIIRYIYVYLCLGLIMISIATFRNNGIIEYSVAMFCPCFYPIFIIIKPFSHYLSFN